MSHLQRPRINFFGEFFANPSTINNNLANYGQQTVSNQGWGPDGLHLFRFSCQIVRVVHAGGPTMSSRSDALVGGVVRTLDTPSTAKLVDLDPRYQMGSEVFGAKLAVCVGGTTVISGALETSMLRDLWVGRVTNTSLSPFERAAGAFHTRVRNATIAPLANSPTITALAGARYLAVKLVVYAYDRNTHKGKLAGTIAPGDSDPIHTGFVGRRLLTSSPQSMVRDFGVADVAIDASASRLTIDIGNAIPEVSVAGSRVDVGQLELHAITPSARVLLGHLDYSKGHFERTSGIEELQLSSTQLAAATANQLALNDTRGNRIILAESPLGLNVEVADPVVRLQPGGSKTTTLWVTRFGAPASGVALTTATQPSPGSRANGLTRPGPPGAPATHTTGANGSTRLRLQAGRLSAQSGHHIDGEVYQVQVSFGGVGASTWGTQTNVRVFEVFTAPASPRWADVAPILRQYARLYPGMNARAPGGLGSHATYQNPGYRQLVLMVLQYQLNDPRYMPVSRDLSEAKRLMLIAWLNAGAP